MTAEVVMPDGQPFVSHPDEFMPGCTFAAINVGQQPVTRLEGSSALSPSDTRLEGSGALSPSDTRLEGSGALSPSDTRLEGSGAPRPSTAACPDVTSVAAAQREFTFGTPPTSVAARRSAA